MKMIIEALLLDAKDGIPIKLRYEDHIFVNVTKNVSDQLKGKIIDHQGGMPIHENILEKIKKAYPHSNLMRKVIYIYSPTIKRVTADTRVGQYKKYIREK